MNVFPMQIQTHAQELAWKDTSAEINPICNVCPWRGVWTAGKHEAYDQHLKTA